MLKGKLGWKGERGYSAYEIAVQNGFEGSEQDWLDTIGVPISTTLDENSTNGTVPGSKTVYDLLKNGGIEIPIIIDHVYTEVDFTRANEIKMNSGNPATEEEMGLYDLNGDGEVTNADLLKINDIINNHAGIVGDNGVIGYIKISKNGGETSVEVRNTEYKTRSKILPGSITVQDLNSNNEVTRYCNINSQYVYIVTDIIKTSVGTNNIGLSYITQSNDNFIDWLNFNLTEGITLNGNYNGEHGDVTITPYKIEVANSTKKTVITPTSVTPNVNK